MKVKDDVRTIETGLKDRPRLDRLVDKEAEKLAEKYILPKPPGKRLNWDQMQEWLALLTPEMWTHVAIYFYRLKPRIIRQLRDPALPNYIDCLSEPISKEYMIDRHGGGRYSLKVVNTDQRKQADPNQHGNMLFECFVEINEVEHPPKLEYEELDINHRDNMSYLALLKHKGIIDGNGKVMLQNQPPAAQSQIGVNTEFLKEILGFVSKMTTEQQASFKETLAGRETDKGGLTAAVGSILVEQMKQSDPNRHLDSTTNLIKNIKELTPEPKADAGAGLVTEFLKMQAEDRKSNRESQEQQRKTDLEYMKLLLEANGKNQNGNSDFAQFQQMFTFAKEIMQIGRAGGAGDRSPWDIGLDYIRELAVPGLQTLNNFLMQKRGGPVPAGGMSGAQPGPMAFDPYANPEALRAYSRAQNAAAPATPPQQNGTGPAGTGSAAPGGLAPLIQQYGMLVVQALNSGVPGDQFADSLCIMCGNATHAAISNLGEDALVQAMMSMPALAMFGPERLKTWAHQFIHFEEMGAEEQEDQPEPAAANGMA